MNHTSEIFPTYTVDIPFQLLFLGHFVERGNDFVKQFINHKQTMFSRLDCDIEPQPIWASISVWRQVFFGDMCSFSGSYGSGGMAVIAAEVLVSEMVVCNGGFKSSNINSSKGNTFQREVDIELRTIHIYHISRINNIPITSHVIVEIPEITCHIAAMWQVISSIVSMCAWISTIKIMNHNLWNVYHHFSCPVFYLSLGEF